MTDFARYRLDEWSDASTPTPRLDTYEARARALDACLKEGGLTGDWWWIAPNNRGGPSIAWAARNEARAGIVFPLFHRAHLLIGDPGIDPCIRCHENRMAVDCGWTPRYPHDPATCTKDDA